MGLRAFPYSQVTNNTPFEQFPRSNIKLKARPSRLPSTPGSSIVFDQLPRSAIHHLGGLSVPLFFDAVMGLKHCQG
jgi:hypothetical protein